MSQFSDHDFKNEKALIRVDFNVPLDEQFNITDDTRMRAAIPTIKKVLDDGGSVILMSHFGRPKSGPEDKFSLKHLLPHLKELLPGTTVLFADDCIGEDAQQKAKDLKPGEVLLLENLRFHKEEEKGDEAFAKKLSELGDVYVNDAFGTAHRAHASTAVIAQFFSADKKMFGLLMNAEISNAHKVLNSSEKPFTAILGGAKVSDKIEIIENLLKKANNIIIGGGMAYTFLKAQGKEIGSSLCEEDKLDLANELLAKAKEKNVEIYLPADSVVADKFAEDASTKTVNNDHI
jgi:phosphoglycerate kinase